MFSTALFSQKKFDLLSYFRNCARCGVSSSPIDLYCPSCWAKLEPYLMGGSVDEPFGFPAQALFLWPPDTTVVGHLVRCLKGSGHFDVFEKLAFEFSSKVSSKSSFWATGSKKIQFVPAPSKGSREVDHAHNWARALCTCWGGELINPLRREGHQTQKRADREERKKVNIRCDKGPFRPSKGIRYVFVDDVITTGATAKAAYKALGQPKLFEVWAIVYRARL